MINTLYDIPSIFSRQISNFHMIFSQKSEMGYTKEHALRLSREEFENYKAQLEKSRTRCIIVDETELDDGSLQMHVKNQYNDTSDVTEYFN